MDTALAVLTPMWQRIARGEVDLDQYSDEEILSGQIRMADGRLLPKPAVYPEPFIREQEKRGLVVARAKVREGAVKSFDVVYDILTDPLAEDKDRLAAAKMLQERFLGKTPQSLNVTVDMDGKDPRDVLLERLLVAKKQTALEVGEIVDAEVVEDGMGLDDLL